MEHTTEVPDGVTPDEMRMATEVAFLQVQEYLGSRGPLDPGDAVIYRVGGGRIHLGPLAVLNTDATTALIAGFMHNNPMAIQVRVKRGELVRVADAKAIVHRILLEAHPCPCPHCGPGKTASRAN